VTIVGLRAPSGSVTVALVGGNFTVDPDELEQRAKALRTLVAEQFDEASQAIRTGGQIGPPGFGVALSPLEAAYVQRLDFMAKDVQGAAEVCRQIADQLQQVAAQYRRAEDLNTTGFTNSGVPAMGYGEAFGQTQGLPAAAGAAAVVASGITVAEIMATSAMMSTAAALCPTFMPAAVAATLFVADPVGIASASGNLSLSGDNLKNFPNAAFDKTCSSATSGWTGEGRDAFVFMTTKVKAHLDELAAYVKTMGEALGSLLVALSGLWIALAAMTVPFLTWLIAARAAMAFPGMQWLEAVIQTTGAMMAKSVTGGFAALVAVGGLVIAFLNGLAKDLMKLVALPDSGTAGTPDLTEFSVGRNFSLS